MRKIPKIIHQTYHTKELPLKLKTITSQLQKMNPDWEYRFYDDADIERFILDKYGQPFFKIYQRINPCYGPARADFFRYLVIYKCGGVYLDVKSACTIPLSELIHANDKILLCHWSPYPGFGRSHKDLSWIEHGELQQWHIIAAPNSPLIKAVICKVIDNIKHYSPWKFGISKIGVLRVTGPIAYTQAIYPRLENYQYRLGPFDSDFDLVYSNLEKDITHHQVYGVNYGLILKPIILPQSKIEHILWYPHILYRKIRRQAGVIKKFIFSQKYKSEINR